MPDTIDQFMWGYQHHFRRGVAYDAELVLAAIGAPLDVQVVLVGYAGDASCRYAVCVEPEDGALPQGLFTDIADRVEANFAADPESQVWNTDPGVHESRQRFLWKKARARATSDIIEASGLLGDVTVFASASNPIGGYEVHTSICVERARFEALPAFDDDYCDRLYAGRSLQHEVLAECLRRADRALFLPNPGSDLDVLGERTDDIVRSAARRFACGCIIRSGEMMAGEIFDAMCSLTSQAYERAPAVGELVVARADHPAVEKAITFARKVDIRAARAVRKLLETSGPDSALLTDGRDVYGLGKVDGHHPDVFEFSVPSHATWVLSGAGTDLLRVSYGRATLPRPVLDRRLFDEMVERVIGPADFGVLWEYVQAATALGHGSTIVVSADAAGEAYRLAGQGTPIEPKVLGPADVARVVRIDGSVLVDPAGVCHAIGLILDGDGEGTGDPSRGSRYNLSVRYQRSAGPRSVIVVASEDGTIDLVPTLRKRVRRETVQAAVDEFVAVAHSNPVVAERFAKAHRGLKDLAFYLDAEQCAVVNRLFNEEQERRFSEGGFQILERDLDPDPEMDDSYFL